jgi:DNA protecting protein DprA
MENTPGQEERCSPRRGQRRVSESSESSGTRPTRRATTPPEPQHIDVAAQKAVGITVEELSALFVLLSLKGFGPQKFKELHLGGVKPLDVVTGRTPLPMTGKRGDNFRRQFEAEVEKERSICEQRAIRQISVASKLGAVIATYTHPAYPRNVFESNNPVPMLYVRGSLDVMQNRKAIACVGSRKIREPYTELHASFARVACRLGFSIVSGFALGADTIGHSVALHGSGQTVCVMPAGLDRPFPPENRHLWEQLLLYKGAALVSEFPFGTAASALTLRRRNKLIVAFALGVLISQSSATGGAMNAYRFALEQGKPVAAFSSDGEPDTSGNVLIAEEATRQSLVGERKGRGLPKPPHPLSTVLPSPMSDSEAYERWLRLLSSST